MVASDGDSINTCSDKTAFKVRLRLTKLKSWLVQTVPHQIPYTYFPTLRNSPADRSPGRRGSLRSPPSWFAYGPSTIASFFSYLVTKYHGVRLNSLHSLICFIIFRLPLDTLSSLWFLRSSAQVFLRLLRFLKVWDSESLIKKEQLKLGKAFTF